MLSKRRQTQLNRAMTYNIGPHVDCHPSARGGVIEIMELRNLQKIGVNSVESIFPYVTIDG